MGSMREAGREYKMGMGLRKRAVDEQNRKWAKARPWDHPLLYQTFSLIHKEISICLFGFGNVVSPCTLPQPK